MEKQDFLDACQDEGVKITAKERKLIREADSAKWKLFVARLLVAGSYRPEMLDALKPEPKEVVMLKE